MELVFATRNPGKMREVALLLPAGIRLLSLDDIGCAGNIEETSATLEGNALLKARHIRDKYGYSCLADDTGLFVHALDGAPGVHSARYAGEQADTEQNIARLLSEMKGIDDRRAYFRTVIALCLDTSTEVFCGRIDGAITRQKSGAHGFGYDAIFKPDGHAYTFAQLPAREKNRISHRALALNKLRAYLRERH